jgi:hypothetical protein
MSTSPIALRPAALFALLLSFGIAVNCNAAVAVDGDADGIEDELELKIGTNPNLADTDDDGLSDYDEAFKYHTDPTKKDSDGDGVPDSDWNERREHAYTIRAGCEIRKPNDIRSMTDFYQDARPLKQAAHSPDASVVEVVIYPYAVPHVIGQPYPLKELPKELEEYVRPTIEMNYSPAMRKDVQRIVAGAQTDVEAVQKILHWIAQETRLVNRVPELAYVRVENNKLAWVGTLGSPELDKQLLETNFFGESMFRRREHGTCSSLAILRGTLLRATGLPTRLIQTLPLINRYEGDYEPLADRLRRRVFARGYEWGENGGGANHMYNEVYLNHHWIRVDSVVGTGVFAGDKIFIKAWSAADLNDLFPRRKPEESWNQDRDLRTLDVSDALPIHRGFLDKMTALDLAVSEATLSFTRLGDRRYEVNVAVENRGSVVSPEVRVDFYAIGAKGERRLVSRHGVGPIMPRGVWGEGNSDFRLKTGENAVMVVVDPEDVAKDANRTNNSATKKIEK